MATFTIGIDIGGTNTDIGLVNDNGQVLDRRNLATATYEHIQNYVDDIVKTVHVLMDKNHIVTIEGIGIGAPNGNYYSGSIVNAANLNFKGIIPLKDMIQKSFHTKVVLTNDANAATYGEKIYGGAKQLNDFIMITLGTGVGSGIFSNGKMIYGYDGMAGELGHITLIYNGRKCKCGRVGCLEEYASSRGICQNYNDLRIKNNLPPLDDIDCLQLSIAAEHGDTLAIQAWKDTAHYLGLALANAVAFVSPQAIFLMGGPVKAGHWLLDPLKVAFEENLLPIYRGHIQLSLSALPENDAAILGAAALVRE